MLFRRQSIESFENYHSRPFGIKSKKFQSMALIILSGDTTGIILGHTWLWFSVVLCLIYIWFYQYYIRRNNSIVFRLFTCYLLVQFIQCVNSIIKRNHLPNAKGPDYVLVFTVVGTAHALSVFNVFMYYLANRLKDVKFNIKVDEQEMHDKLKSAMSQVRNKSKQIVLLHIGSFSFYLLIIYSIILATGEIFSAIVILFFLFFNIVTVIFAFKFAFVLKNSKNCDLVKMQTKINPHALDFDRVVVLAFVSAISMFTVVFMISMIS